MSPEGLHNHPQNCQSYSCHTSSAVMVCSGRISSFSLLPFCFFFPGFLFLCLFATINFVTKKPQCNSRRTFLLASQEFLLLHARAVVFHFSAVALLEDGAGLMNTWRTKCKGHLTQPAAKPTHPSDMGVHATMCAQELQPPHCLCGPEEKSVVVSLKVVFCKGHFELTATEEELPAY